MSPDINKSAVITVKGFDYRFITYGISRSDAIHLLENSFLNDREFT